MDSPPSNSNGGHEAPPGDAALPQPESPGAPDTELAPGNDAKTDPPAGAPRLGVPGVGFSKRGVTAAEALASELYREIAVREELERRLRTAEELLAGNGAPAAKSGIPIPAPPAPPSADAVRAAQLEQQLADSTQKLAQTQALLAQFEQRLGRAEERIASRPANGPAPAAPAAPAAVSESEPVRDAAYYAPGYREMLGYNGDELPDTHQTFLDLLHPEDATNDFLTERDSIGDGVNLFTRTLRLKHKDGSYRWIESIGQEYLDQAGQRTRVLGFHRDITARKAREEHLRESEERFNLLLSGSPLGFFDADLVSGRAYYSPLFKSMLGYRIEDLPDTSQTRLDLMHPDDRTAVSTVKAQRSFGESRRPFSHTLRLRHKEGRYSWIMAYGVDFFSPDGRLLRTVGFHADIDALKTAQDALATENESLGVTLDSISDAVIATDAAGGVTYLNASAEEFCGFTRTEAKGLPIEEFYSLAGAQPRRQTENPVRAVLASSRPIAPHDPAHLRTPGHPERIIAETAAPILAAGGAVTGAVLVLHDITDSHRTAEELQKTNRIESLGVLAGGIAHDFNNLLTSVLGNLSVARFEGDLPARAGDALIRAERACWRARDLTGQLLTFSRGGDPVRKPLDLLPLIEQAVRGALHNQPGIQFDIEPGDSLPPVEADEGQIAQVIHNISLNAVQAMPDGGSLRVGAKLRQGSPATERPELSAEAYVEISLTDTGTGIAPENLSKIFDPFFSTRHDGTGLGLAAAYSIVRKHEGLIRVESSPGAGSRFAVYLPVAPQALPPASMAPASKSARPTGRILFMDDDPDILELAGAILGLLGCEAVLVRDGVEVLAEYQAARAAGGRPFAAVILDLTIPGGMGGKETIRRLHELDPGVRAIVSSGYSNDAVLADFRAHGFAAMVAKPYRMEDLARALGEAIGGVE